MGFARQRLNLHLSCQGSWYARGDLPGVRNDVFTIHGSGLLANTADPFATAVAYSQLQVEDQLGNTYFANRPTVDRTANAYFLLDIEAPIHPSDLHLLSAGDQDLCVTAWKRRIAAARTVLPNARIGMYATMIPDERGDPADATFIARQLALLEAVSEGWLDGIDWLCPVLYMRFGPLDNVGQWSTRERYFKQGIDATRELHATKPIMPLFSTRVENGSSQHNDVQILDLPDMKVGGVASALALREPQERYLARTWGLLQKVCVERGVGDLCLWVGSPDEDGFLPGQSKWRVRDWFGHY